MSSFSGCPASQSPPARISLSTSSAATLAIAAVAAQADRADLEQQRGRAPLRRRLRVEHGRGTRRERERLDPVRVLVQQVAKVGGGRAGGGDRQQHTSLWPPPARQI